VKWEIRHWLRHAFRVDSELLRDSQIVAMNIPDIYPDMGLKLI